MINIHNNSTWTDVLTISQEEGREERLSQLSSWNKKPVTDVQIVEGTSMCPPDFTEDLIYDIWPGTRVYCDCL